MTLQISCGALLAATLFLAAPMSVAQAPPPTQPSVPTGGGATTSGSGCKYQYEGKAGGTMRQGYLDNGQALQGPYHKYQCVNGKMKQLD
jgi:hypothetical protein